MNHLNKIILLSALFIYGCTSNIKEEPYRYFYNPDLGISFAHNPDWTFEVKYTKDTNEPHIVGRAPLEDGFFKMMTIEFSEEENLDLAIKIWWIQEDEENNISENKLTFEPIKPNRYQGVTYAANRAQIRVPKYNSVLDYRVFATRKNGKTIIICEKSDIGGMNGLEGDGFAIVEKSINYMKY